MQAARGAAVAADDAPADVRDRPATRWLWLTALVVLARDVVSKVLVVAKLSDRSPVHVIGHVLQLTVTRNAGRGILGRDRRDDPVHCCRGRRRRRHRPDRSVGCASRGWAVVARAAARRGARQPQRPAVPLAGAVPRPCRRLDRAAALADLQPRRQRRSSWAGCSPCCCRCSGSSWTDRRGERTSASSRSRTVWTACGSTSPCPGCSGSRAPRPRRLVEAGAVLVDGAAPAKSDRVVAGSWLEVRLPEPAVAQPIPAEPVPGLVVVYDDDDIVVVDKPVGVAAHPSPGWNGPTVTGGLAAAGYRISTSGAAERQGVVHRLDVGTTGLMVVAKSERAYTALKDGLPGAHGRQALHRPGAGPSRPEPRARSTRRSGGTRPTTTSWAVVAGGRPSVTHYETIEAFRAASCSTSGSRPAAPTRSGCTWPRSGIPASVT